MSLIHPQKPPEQPFSNDPQASYTLASRYYTDANISAGPKIRCPSSWVHEQIPSEVWLEQILCIFWPSAGWT